MNRAQQHIKRKPNTNIRCVCRLSLHIYNYQIMHDVSFAAATKHHIILRLFFGRFEWANCRLNYGAGGVGVMPFRWPLVNPPRATDFTLALYRAFAHTQTHTHCTHSVYGFRSIYTRQLTTIRTELQQRQQRQRNHHRMCMSDHIQQPW